MAVAYFPVSAEPLRMKAGLFAFGTDFGNGVEDCRYFQLDEQHARYVAAKAKVSSARHWAVEEAGLEHVHDAALQWFRTTLQREHPGLLPTSRGGSLLERYDEILSRVQEDAALIHRGDGAGRALMMHVCFPSGWRPEALSGASFKRIHQPVPGFGGERLGQSMMDAMIDRGPWVRFVWTVSADDLLDHHPADVQRAAWTAETRRAWLRVERQVTVPLRSVDSSVFLIRTYLYPVDSLTPEQRHILATALQGLPDEIAAYKGLLAGRTRMLQLLQ